MPINGTIQTKVDEFSTDLGPRITILAFFQNYNLPKRVVFL